MHYQGTIYRPPSEANSILLQITTGCSHNKCTFCEMYKDIRFSIKEMLIIMEDIKFAATYCKRQRKVFLCDGDALIVPQEKLLTILAAIHEQLPWVTRVSTYANSKSIRLKSDTELRQLVESGLTLAYVGLESGDDETLQAINKGSDSAGIIRQCSRLHQAGFKLSLTVLLGIAGRENSMKHAKATGKALSAIDPKFVGALTLMLTPGTPLYKDAQKELFHLPNAQEILAELAMMIEHTNLSSGMFHANHASNYLPIQARLPRDKQRVLEELEAALQGKRRLKDEWMRGL